MSRTALSTLSFNLRGMYQIRIVPFGEFNKYVIEDTALGNGFSIVPEVGATVLDIWVAGSSILDGYEGPQALKAGGWGKSSVLFPFPNRLKDGQYEWEGYSYQFPINNMDTGNAIHGFVRSMPFRVTDSTATVHSASITVVYSYDGHLSYYPFPFELELTFAMEVNRFWMQVQVQNLHVHSIPVGFGWHPYFRLSDRVEDLALTVPACKKVVIDDRMIPTGALDTFKEFEGGQKLGDTFLDNCFLAEGDYELILRAENRQLAVKASMQDFPYFQVFTPPHRSSVALEPMSCTVDAFNNGGGLVRLMPGATWGASMELVVTD